MKKLDWLAIKSFIGPFILTFCIALFVLVMQFLWKYIDDLVGKGLTIPVVIELLFYASAKLVPMALPLAVLLASIMTMGSFGEHMELTATKAAGISLLRFLQPLAVTVTIIGIFAFFFSNSLLPKANLKFGALLYDIRHQKPIMALKEGIFYSGIEGYSIRAMRKGEDGKSIYDVTVYDHTSGQGNDHVITAEKGIMDQEDEKLVLILKLYNGHQYKDVQPKDPLKKTYGMYRSAFKTYEKKFDLSQFKLNRSDENYFKDMRQMMSLAQLQLEEDSVKNGEQTLIKGLHDYLFPYYAYRRLGLDSVKKGEKEAASLTNFDAAFKAIPKADKLLIVERAMNQARNVKNYTGITTKQLEFKEKEWVNVMIEIYRKFTLAIACLVLFLVGAPLGSIIRKGGLGWPLFYAVIFFIFYHVSSIIGEKMCEKDKLTVFNGMWLSTYVLLPIGLFLTIKATDDSRLFHADWYLKLFRNKKKADAKVIL